uniref:Uncharacterized protein n=1 Tax=Vitis vinifera TaxID=29760 RepID=F6H4T4_VITVI
MGAPFEKRPQPWQSCLASRSVAAVGQSSRVGRRSCARLRRLLLKSGEKKKTVIGVVPKSAWTTSIENFL